MLAELSRYRRTFITTPIPSIFPAFSVPVAYWRPPKLVNVRAPWHEKDTTSALGTVQSAQFSLARHEISFAVFGADGSGKSA
jgi:hypothetical protein